MDLGPIGDCRGLLGRTRYHNVKLSLTRICNSGLLLPSLFIRHPSCEELGSEQMRQMQAVWVAATCASSHKSASASTSTSQHTTLQQSQDNPSSISPKRLLCCNADRAENSASSPVLPRTDMGKSSTIQPSLNDPVGSFWEKHARL